MTKQEAAVYINNLIAKSMICGRHETALNMAIEALQPEEDKVNNFKKKVLDEIDREINIYSDNTSRENLIAVITLMKLSKIISNWREI